MQSDLALVHQELTKPLIVKAAKELNENEKTVRESLKQLKAFIADEPVPYCTDDDFLILFLRAKKFNVRKSLQQLKNYSRLRQTNMRYFTTTDFETVKRVLESNVFGVLPRRDHEGRAVLYFRASQFSSELMSPDDVVGAIHILTHFIMSFPPSQVSGLTFIADASIQSLEIMKLVFKYVSAFAPTMQDFPARFQRVDCVNVNVLFRAAFRVLKPVVPSKLFRRTTLHGCQKTALTSIYHPSILPEEFGGMLGPFKDLHRDWIQDFEKYLPSLFASNAFYNICS